jgi:hypothetical protein
LENENSASRANTYAAVDICRYFVFYINIVNTRDYDGQKSRYLCDASSWYGSRLGQFARAPAPECADAKLERVKGIEPSS